MREGRDAYLARLQRYRDKIAEREQRLLSFLAVPRTLDEIVAHRFVYRPHDRVPGIDQVERRSMTQHLERLLRNGAVEELEDGRYLVR